MKSVLIGTDKGQIVRVNLNTLTDSVVYTSADDTRSVISLVAKPGDSTMLSAYQDLGTGDFRSQWSDDAGETWSDVLINGTPPLDWPQNWPTNTSSTLTPMDDSGNLVGIIVDSSGTNSHIYTSSDHGVTWFAHQFTHGPRSSYPPSSHYIWRNGYVWWHATIGLESSQPAYIAGVKTDGTSFVITSDLGDIGSSNVNPFGSSTCDIIYVWRFNPSDQMAMVDISSGSPIVSYFTPPSSFQPYILPITNDIALYYVFGNLYRTVNRAASWTTVLTDTTLNISPAGGVPAIAVDGNTVAIIATFPDIWFSNDLGITWTKYTVVSTLLIGTTLWRGIVCHAPNVHAGISKNKQSDTTEAWFLRTDND